MTFNFVLKEVINTYFYYLNTTLDIYFKILFSIGEWVSFGKIISAKKNIPTIKQ